MITKTMWRRLGVAAAAAALFAGACGGDDDDVAAGGDTEQAADAGAADGESTDTGGGATDSADTGGEEFTGADSGDFCSFAQEAEDASADLDILGDASSVQEDFESLFDLFDEAIDKAPDEIKSDFETLADGMHEMQRLLEDADYDFTVVDETAMNEVIDNQTFNDASNRIDQYMTEVCGLEDSSSTDTGTDAIDPTTEAAIIAGIFGIEEDQASCLLENGLDYQDPASFEQAASIFETCGVDPSIIGE